MWKIYYGDYSTYSDQDGPPWESPIMDVQVIAVPDSVVVGKTWEYIQVKLEGQ